MEKERAVDYSHITTVIFDMDGTLIRHTWQLSQITEALFEQFAEQLAPLTHEQFFERFWTKSEDLWYMMVDGAIDGNTVAKYSYFNTLRSFEKDTSIAEAMLARWNELVLIEAKPFADTYSVLDTLRQTYKVGILTNGFITLQRQKIEKYGLADHVDFTLVSEETGYHKPDKRVFDVALSMAGDGGIPEKTLYVGDNLVADIQGAQEAGLTPILIDPHNRVEPPPGIDKIDSLSELLELLA
ncbi:MAG: HAD family hydrolase [Anaerolineae bacterium]|nr:HAD family hydrolase [Anaerolineae bacterium]